MIVTVNSVLFALAGLVLAVALFFLGRASRECPRPHCSSRCSTDLRRSGGAR